MHHAQAPDGLKPYLATVMHLIDSLARMRLLVEATVSVPFSTNEGLMSVFRGKAPLTARRYVAAHLTVDTISKLRRGIDPSAPPDFDLMQQLYDAGIGKCPCSGMPIFNPSACADGLLTALWRAYCGIATTVNIKKSGATGELLDELKRHLREHVISS